MKFTFLLALACLAVAPASAANDPSPPIIAIDGRPFALSDHAGQWVLINYWATWCVPCIAEMPILSAIARERPKLVVIGLTTEAISADALRAFLAKRPVSYRIAIVDKVTAPRKFSGSWMGMQARPLTYLIRPDGTLAKRFVGEVTAAKLNAVLDAPPR